MDYTNNIGLSAFLEDAKRFGSKPNLKDFILHNEKWYIYHYIKLLFKESSVLTITPQGN